MRDNYGRNTFGQLSAGPRLIEAGTRVVEVIWPKIANLTTIWDVHVDLTKRMKPNPPYALTKVWLR
jgi:hypothetical protein